MSHGFVVIVPWKETIVLLPENKVPVVQQIFDWSAEFLDDIIIEHGADPGFKTDYNTTFGEICYLLILYSTFEHYSIITLLMRFVKSGSYSIIKLSMIFVASLPHTELIKPIGHP